MTTLEMNRVMEIKDEYQANAGNWIVLRAEIDFLENGTAYSIGTDAAIDEHCDLFPEQYDEF